MLPSAVAATSSSPYLLLIEYSGSEEHLCCTPSPQIPTTGTSPIQVNSIVPVCNISNASKLQTPNSTIVGIMRKSLEDTAARQSGHVIGTHNGVHLVDLGDISDDDKSNDVPLNSSQCTLQASTMKAECSIASFGQSLDPAYNAV